MSPASEIPPLPAFREALRYWLKLGCISFGGPAGQIALMHRELVDRRRWISESHFLHALNFCMLLPGPEAQQLATYLGWRIHGCRGGVAAGVLFVLPSVFILFGLSWLYMAGGHLPWLASVFYGLNAAVIALIAAAVLKIGRKALRSPALWSIAAASFVLTRFCGVSFALLIPVVAMVGWLGHRFWPQQFPAGNEPAIGTPPESKFVRLPVAPQATLRRAVGVTTICVLLWAGPLLTAGWLLGWGSAVAGMGLFFSRTALITFGGAYAILPYVAAQADGIHHWLAPEQMMAGLALAETTPGPLIMVLQFVGFAGGWNHPGSLDPLGAAAAGALLTTWVTFVPCFLFVLLGAPHVETLCRQPGPAAALTAVTAAVAGVILNLAVVFTVHACWPAQGADWFIIVLSIIALAVLRHGKAGTLPVIGGCALAGFLWRFVAEF